MNEGTKIESGGTAETIDFIDDLTFSH